MHIIVGSTAINKTQIIFRNPNDLDVWTDDKIYLEQEKVKQGVDIKLIPKHILELIETPDGLHCTPNDVYTIKRSHLGWKNPCWNKHKTDIILLKSQGCNLKQELFTALVDYWREEFGNKDFLSLKKDKKEFFTDNVVYVYDHDWLHEQVSAPEAPIYTTCLKYNEDVLIDKDAFDSLELASKVRMFREEITVIAIERYLVNPKMKGRFSWFRAYQLSLHKTITQLTKGWATNFIVLNLEHFIKPDYTYFKHALNVIKQKENYLCHMKTQN